MSFGVSPVNYSDSDSDRSISDHHLRCGASVHVLNMVLFKFSLNNTIFKHMDRGVLGEQGVQVIINLYRGVLGRDFLFYFIFFFAEADFVYYRSLTEVTRIRF